MNKLPSYGVAIDQWRNVYYFGKSARKDLCEQLGSKHVDIMYQDKTDGTAVRVGYIIAGHWLTLYAPVELPV